MDLKRIEDIREKINKEVEFGYQNGSMQDDFIKKLLREEKLLESLYGIN